MLTTARELYDFDWDTAHPTARYARIDPRARPHPRRLRQDHRQRAPHRAERRALLAVRGTQFDVEVNREGETTLDVFEGIVEVRSSLQQPPFTVTAGQESLFGLRSPRRPPHARAPPQQRPRRRSRQEQQWPRPGSQRRSQGRTGHAAGSSTERQRSWAAVRQSTATTATAQTAGGDVVRARSVTLKRCHHGIYLNSFAVSLC